MPRGGHAASGPPPDPNALRRDRPSDKAGWTTLPAEGRQGPPPEWPLLDQTEREAHLWADLWCKPQAVAWERYGQAYEVATCVRMLARAEQPKSSVELLKSLKTFFDSLGLSTSGMLRNRWRIAEGGEETTQPARAGGGKATTRRSTRSRLKVVADADAG